MSNNLSLSEGFIVERKGEDEIKGDIVSSDVVTHINKEQRE